MVKATAIIKKVFSIILSVAQEISEDSIYAVSGHASLFMIISFFPFVSLLLSLLQFLPFSKETVYEFFSHFSNGIIERIIHSAINEIYGIKNTLTLSVSLIAVLWSASTSAYSVVLGLNRVYRVTKRKSYFFNRAISLLYTMIFIFAIIIMFLFSIFGKRILEYIIMLYGIPKSEVLIINISRSIISVIIPILIFDLIYTFVPHRKSKLKSELPGAVFSSLGWNIFSSVYGLYTESRKTVIYGSISTIVITMIWLYFCFYIFFIGAVINRRLKNYKSQKNRVP